MTDWLLARSFTRRLMKLRRFAVMVEENLVERAAALDRELTAAESLPAHEREDLRDWYADDFLELGDELPTVLRYAVLTSADSASEAFLNSTCDAYAEVSSTALRVRDLRGSGIVRAQTYLKKVAGVRFPDDKPIWTTVVRLHELRNSIVHAEGVVAASRQDIRLWSSHMPGLTISDHGVISLGADFTGAALDACESFAVEIDQSVDHLGLWKLDMPFESI